MTTNSCSSNDLILLSVPFLPVNLVNSPKPLGSFLPPTLLPLPLPLVAVLALVAALVVTVEAAAKSQCHESMMILPSFSSSGPNNPASHPTLPYPTLFYRGTFQKRKKIVIKKEHYSPFFDDVYWMIQKGKKGEIFFKKNEAIASRGWKHGFFENQDQRNETKKKGTCWEARCFRNCSRSPSRAIESSRVESSSSNGPFFLFCFNNSLGRLRFPFFSLFSSFNPHVLRFIVLARRWTGVE